MQDHEIWDKVESMSAEQVTALLFVEDEPRKSDLILVFGHKSKLRSQQRARHAADLFNRGLAPKILVSGGKTTDPQESEARWMRDELVKAGVSTSHVLEEASAKTTPQNLEYARRTLKRNSILKKDLTVILVSCPWHMARVRHLTRAAFPEWKLICSPHQESCTATNWASCSECRELIQTNRNQKCETYYALRCGLV